jgi:hypothetical protein
MSACCADPCESIFQNFDNPSSNKKDIKTEKKADMHDLAMNRQMRY